VITAPASNSFLQSISLSPVDDVVNPATHFGVSIFDWSQSLQQPTGAPLYTSSQKPIGPETFTANIGLTPLDQYIIELIGNGAADFPAAPSGAFAVPQLYFLQTSQPGNEFSNASYALNMGLTYAPLPAALPMFGSAVLALAGFAGWSRRAGRG
jgi:hypothetical protein